MEDQERLEQENEDVEAHGNVGAPATPAPAMGREDEGDDVEAHAYAPKGAPKAG
jgi:hypothetical protein